MPGDDPRPCDGCDACLDWRVAQSRDLGEHIARVVEQIIGDLGLDPYDPAVRDVVRRRLAEAGAEPA